MADDSARGAIRTGRLAVRAWLFGYYIVEHKQGGPDQAQLHGKAPEIQQTLSVESGAHPST